MKNFFKGLLIQIVVIIVTISGVVLALSLFGAFYNFGFDVTIILLVTGAIFAGSVTFLREKKVTLDEFLTALWPGFIPW